MPMPCTCLQLLEREHAIQRVERVGTHTALAVGDAAAVGAIAFELAHVDHRRQSLPFGAGTRWTADVANVLGVDVIVSIATDRELAIVALHLGSAAPAFGRSYGLKLGHARAGRVAHDQTKLFPCLRRLCDARSCKKSNQ